MPTELVGARCRPSLIRPLNPRGPPRPASRRPFAPRPGSPGSASASSRLHVVDDNFLQPEPGMSAGGSPRQRPGAARAARLGAAASTRAFGRALRGVARALLRCPRVVVGGIEAAYYAQDVGLSGDDYTGLLSIAAGFLLLGVGAVTLWRSRRRTAISLWRYARRRAARARGSARRRASSCSRSRSSYVVTHVAPADVPAANLGAPYEDVQFTTSDGYLLKGWYVPSRNGAAVISFPGRSGTA